MALALRPTLITAVNGEEYLVRLAVEAEQEKHNRASVSGGKRKVSDGQNTLKRPLLQMHF